LLSDTTTSTDSVCAEAACEMHKIANASSSLLMFFFMVIMFVLFVFEIIL